MHTPSRFMCKSHVQTVRGLLLNQLWRFVMMVQLCSVLNNEMCLKRWEQQHPGEGQESWPASSEPFARCSCTQVSLRTKCTSTVYKFLNLVLFFYSECWFSQCLLTAAMPLQTCTVLSCYSTFCCYRKPAVNVEWLASWHQVHPHHPYHCGPSLSPSPFALRSHCYLSWFS